MGKKILGWVLIVWMVGVLVTQTPRLLREGHPVPFLIGFHAAVLAILGIGIALVLREASPPPNDPEN